MEQILREKVKELLKKKTIDLFIGYTISDPEKNTFKPAFITDPKQADKLTFNSYCFNNLALYLTKDEVKNRYKKIGLLCKGCDARAVITLCQENQIERDSVYVIAVTCNGVYKDNQLYEKISKENIADKCPGCKVTNPPASIANEIIGDPVNDDKNNPVNMQNPISIWWENFDKLPNETKWLYFKAEFDKCIKCYACRQVCPLCYCTMCIADQNLPRFFTKASDSSGNAAWNIVRAYHLTGRCIGCGECERVCPVGIPLMKINKRMSQAVKEFFDYEGGLDKDSPPALVTFKNDDEENLFHG